MACLSFPLGTIAIEANATAPKSPAATTAQSDADTPIPTIEHRRGGGANPDVNCFADVDEPSPRSISATPEQFERSFRLSPSLQIDAYVDVGQNALNQLQITSTTSTEAQGR